MANGVMSECGDVRRAEGEGVGRERESERERMVRGEVGRMCGVERGDAKGDW